MVELITILFLSCTHPDLIMNDLYCVSVYGETEIMSIAYTSECPNSRIDFSRIPNKPYIYEEFYSSSEYSYE